jgi:riboflavin synthase
MFTGIITDVGRVRSIERRGDTRIVIETGFDVSGIAIGASIACSGPCLTVVGTGPGWFAVDASAETLSRTTLGDWRQGVRVNLERAMRLGDELGGHIVSGHVDGVAEIAAVVPEGDSTRFSFALPETLARYVAEKGSIAIEGVSLTVNEVDGVTFGVNIIPHTREHTTFGDLRPGGRANIEIDMIARYVARLLGKE